MSDQRRIDLNQALPEQELSELRSVLTALKNDGSTDPQVIRFTESLVDEADREKEEVAE